MAETKKTMSVPEMRRMLGLKKTDAYWLVHKNCFETIIVENRMRIVIESFEKWYANQIKHKKVDGPPPGEELRAYSYSIPEMAEVIGVSDDLAYTIIRREGLETFEVDYWKRIRKDVFEAWYQSQTKYRTAADKERDKELEDASYTMPEIARMLLISRKDVYTILQSPKNKGKFEFITVAERKRVTKESFEVWYASQRKYRKLSDRSEEEQELIRLAKKQEQEPRLKVDPGKTAYDLQETAVLLDLPVSMVRKMIANGELESKKYGKRYLVRRDEIEWWLLQQKLSTES